MAAYQGATTATGKTVIGLTSAAVTVGQTVKKISSLVGAKAADGAEVVEAAEPELIEGGELPKTQDVRCSKLLSLCVATSG